MMGRRALAEGRHAALDGAHGRQDDAVSEGARRPSGASRAGNAMRRGRIRRGVKGPFNQKRPQDGALQPNLLLQGPLQRDWAALQQALAVGVLVAASAVGVLGYHAYDDRRADVAAAEGISALRAAVPRILSYDHRELDADFAEAAELLGGELRAEFLRTAAVSIGPAAVRDRQTITASVAAIGLVTADRNRVIAVAFVDQQTASDGDLEPRTTESRIRFTIERFSSRWLVTSIDVL